MNPKIQLDAEADGSAMSRGSSETGPSTVMMGVPAGSLEGTSTLSMTVGAEVVRVTGRRVGVAVRGAAVTAGVGVAGFGVGVFVGFGVPGDGQGRSSVPGGSGFG